MEYKDLCRAIDNCEECTLHAMVHVPGVGNIHSDVMFVGEAPGEIESERKVPFVGPAGVLFRDLLQRAGFDIDQIYITNVAKCRPMSGRKNRQPTTAEIQACSYILEAEVAMVNPKVIVCVGSVAMNALIAPPETITRVHGRWYMRNGRNMITMFHPSYILHKGTDDPEAEIITQQVLNVLADVQNRLRNLREATHA